MHTSIDRRFRNGYNMPFVFSQVLCDELSVSYGRNIYSWCRMDFAAETVQPMGPQLVSHGILKIDTLNENSGIWSPATTPNTTHGSAFRNVLRQGTVVGEAVGKIGRKTTKLILKVRTKIPNFKTSAKILKQFDHLWIRVLLVQKRQAQKHQQ